MSEYANSSHQTQVEATLVCQQAVQAQRLQHERIGARVLAKTRAYGKLILFGEHFVVYKVPALVGAVAAYTDCECEIVDDNNNDDSAGGGFTVIDNRPAVPGYKVKKQDEADQAIRLVLEYLKIDTQQQQRLKLTFGGDLTCVSGIGASAAQVVSLARALNAEYQLRLSLDEINAAGYQGEKGYHGTPSGIDNTASTFGGILRFQRTDGEPIFVKKKLAQPIRIVYASTGITASTTAVVGDVRAKKDSDPTWFEGLMKQYIEIVTQGETALQEGDMTKLGQLLNENHALLQQLTVSCPELDDLVDAARAAGALGAKMSGTGRGGLVLALTPTEELQDAVAAALQAKGAPQVWKTTLA